MTLGLLGYGPAEDLLAVLRSRQTTRRPTPELRVSSGQIAGFRSYARLLANMHAYHGSGADEQDVEQTALIAAWEAIEDYQQGSKSLKRFVQERMRWRVIDLVRVRGSGGQRAAERFTRALAD